MDTHLNMDDLNPIKIPDSGEESNKESGNGSIPIMTTERNNNVVLSQQPNAMLSQILPLQYSPDLAYSAYLLGYTGSLMAATRQYLPQAVLPSFGALSAPNFLQQQPISIDLNPLITDIKPSELNLKDESSPAYNPKHGVKRSHEPSPSSQDPTKTLDYTIPSFTMNNNGLYSLFNPLTVTSSSDLDILSSMIPKSSSNSDMSMTRGILTGNEKLASKRPASVTDLAQEEKLKMNRDRNREHARSTRLRKKAYVSKLKELVDGLHVELSEDARKRRVASQHIAELQRARRSVIISFLKFLANNNQTDDRKLHTFMEENFVLKQPVTPYRWFRPNEIDGVCLSILVEK